MPLKLQHDEMPTLNLTSMIDVLFLLIIFFMVATKFDEMERNIEVAVPKVAQAGEVRRRHSRWCVACMADGQLEFDGKAVTADGTDLAAGRGSHSAHRANGRHPRRREVPVSACGDGARRLPASRHFGTGHHRSHRQCRRNDTLKRYEADMRESHACTVACGAVLPCFASVQLAYWLAWGGSLALSITLVVLMWTRWGHSRPLQKCAVLSLFVHLILAFLTMTVRIVTGDGRRRWRRGRTDSRADRGRIRGTPTHSWQR